LLTSGGADLDQNPNIDVWVSHPVSFSPTRSVGSNWLSVIERPLVAEVIPNRACLLDITAPSAYQPQSPTVSLRHENGGFMVWTPADSTTMYSPGVSLLANSTASFGALTSASNCVGANSTDALNNYRYLAADANFQRCSEITFQIPLEPELGRIGDLPFFILNAGQNATVCGVAVANSLLPTPPAVVTTATSYKVADGQVPSARVCVANVDGSDNAVTLDGTFFRMGPTGVPTNITMNDAQLPSILVACATIAQDLDRCDAANVTIAANALAVGMVDIRARAAGECLRTYSNELEVVPRPVINQTVARHCDLPAGCTVQNVYCVDTGGVITLEGASFSGGVAQVTLLNNAGEVPRPACAGLGCKPASINAGVAGEYVSRVTAMFDANSPLSGQYDIQVTNVHGCTDIFPLGVHVQPKLLAFFVDPPVTYTGISLQVTIFAAGLLNTVWMVELFHESDLVNPKLTFNREDTSNDEGDFNRIRIVIPQDTIPGVYSVQLTSEYGCGTFAQDLFTVAANAVVRVDETSPRAVYDQRDNGIEVLINGGLGALDVAFLDGVRVYASPTNPQPGDLASALRAVVFVDEKTLTMTIKSGQFAPGSYDIIVVNPDDPNDVPDNGLTVGVLLSAFDVLPYLPLEVTNITPQSWEGKSTPATVQGVGFPVAANIEVDLLCEDPTNTLVLLSAVPVSLDTGFTHTDTVLGILQADPAGGSRYCYVRVTNTVDGVESIYGGVSFSNPSFKYNAFIATASLQTARRGLTAAAMEVNVKSRYIYAMGGDTNISTDPAGFLDSVEVTKINSDGSLGGFSTTSNLDVPVSYGCSRFWRVISSRLSSLFCSLLFSHKLTFIMNLFTINSRCNWPICLCHRRHWQRRRGDERATRHAA
jgi:hypothetical protein